MPRQWVGKSELGDVSTGEGLRAHRDPSFSLWEEGEGDLVEGREVTRPRSCAVGTQLALGSHPHTLPKPSWGF